MVGSWLLLEACLQENLQDAGGLLVVTLLNVAPVYIEVIDIEINVN